MKKKINNQRFWNRYAGFYDWEIRAFSGTAYQKMYGYIRQRLTDDMTVLEVATGTGLIAINIANAVKQLEALDYSAKMIKVAKKKKVPGNLNFTVGDATALDYPPAYFDAVIICNALHIMPQPEIVLENIRRVLKPDGLLIAPCYSHGHIEQKTWDLNAKLLKHLGFETYGRWTVQQYVDFITANGFSVDSWQVLNAAFPLVYLEATKR